MIQISLDGETKQVTPAEFLDLMTRLVSNACIVARSLYQCYRTGAFDKLDDIRRYLPPPADFQSLEEIILNDQVRGWAGIPGTKISIIKMHDDTIARLLAQQAKAPGPQTSQDKAKKPRAFTGPAEHEFRIRVDLVRSCIIEMQACLWALKNWAPGLLATPGLKLVRENASVAFSTPFALPDLPGKRPLAMKIMTSLEEYLKLREQYAEHPETRPQPRRHPTAQDLTEAAELEPDPRRAIRLLKRALGYGLRGFEAMLVYAELGMRYEELGSDKKAIEYCTQAVEELGGDAIYGEMFLTRGRAHFRLGHFDEAKSELEQAIRLDLDDESREEAENYLTKIESQHPH